MRRSGAGADEGRLRAGVVQDAGRDGVAFGVVGVEQGSGCVAVHCGGEFPAEVDGVLDAHVESLAAGGEVDVGCVAGEQYAALPVLVGLACGVTEAGDPAGAAHAEVGAGDPGQGFPELFEGRRFVVGDAVVLRGDDPVPAGFEGDGGVVAEGGAAYPDVVLGQVGELDVADEGGHGRFGAGEADAGEFADGAAAAVAAHEVAGVQCRGVRFRRAQPDGHAVLVLGGAGDLARAAYPYAEFRGPFLEESFDGGLQDHQRVGVPGLGLVEVDVETGEVADRLELALGQEAVQDAALVEDFQGAGVDPAGPGLAGPLGELVDHRHVDARQP